MREEYSNNVRLTRDNRQQDWMTVLQAGFSVQEARGQDWYGYIRTQGEYRKYLRQTYDDETRAQMAANMTATLLPRSLSWTVEDYYGQTLINSRSPDVPNNISNVNVFQTGPNVGLDFSSVDSLGLAARGGSYRIEPGRTDARLLSAEENYTRRVSEITAVSVIARQSSVDFELDADNRDYTRRDFLARIQRRTVADTVTVESGRSRITPERTETATGAYGRGAWSHAIRPDLGFGLTGSVRLGDPAADVATAGGVSPSQAPLGAATGGDIYRVRESEMSIERRDGRVLDSVRLFRRQFDYERSPLDQRQVGGAGQIAWEFSTTVIGTVSGSYVRSEFTDVATVTRDHVGGIGVSYEIRQSFFFFGETRYIRRGSTDATQEYDEARVIVGVAYNSLPRPIDMERNFLR